MLQVHTESGGSIQARDAVVIATNSPINRNCETLSGDCCVALGNLLLDACLQSVR